MTVITALIFTHSECVARVALKTGCGQPHCWHVDILNREKQLYQWARKRDHQNWSCISCLMCQWRGLEGPFLFSLVCLLKCIGKNYHGTGCWETSRGRRFISQGPHSCPSARRTLLFKATLCCFSYLKNDSFKIICPTKARYCLCWSLWCLCRFEHMETGELASQRQASGVYVGVWWVPNRQPKLHCPLPAHPGCLSPCYKYSELEKNIFR